MKNKCFEIVAKASGAVKVSIYDAIDEYTFRDFRKQLDAFENAEEIELRLNTPGGSVVDGFAIYNALIQHPATVTAYIDGWAASMGSIIAMAADKVIMPENSWMMIHNPWTVAMGDADDLRDMADIIDKMKAQAVSAYQRHTDLSAEEIGELMDAETWMTGTEAVELGFADEVVESLEMAASVIESRLENIPEAAMSIFKNEEVPEEKEEEIKEDDVEASDDSEDDEEVEGSEEPEASDEETSEEEEVIEDEDEADACAVAYDEGYLAGEAKGKVDALVSVEGQIEDLRSQVAKAEAERDSVKSDLDAVKVDLDAEREKSAKMAGGFRNVAGEEEAVPPTWKDALDKYGHVDAKAKFPELYKSFMDSREK